MNGKCGNQSLLRTTTSNKPHLAAFVICSRMCTLALVKLKLCLPTLLQALSFLTCLWGERQLLCKRSHSLPVRRKSRPGQKDMEV